MLLLAHTRPPSPCAAVREQLLVLHRELVANIMELLTLLVEKPSAYARQVGFCLPVCLHG